MDARPFVCWEMYHDDANKNYIRMHARYVIIVYASWVPQRFQISIFTLDKTKRHLSKLKAPSDVLKRWEKPSYGRRKNLPRWKYRKDFSHMLGNQIPSRASNFIQQQHDAKNKIYSGFWKENWMLAVCYSATTCVVVPFNLCHCNPFEKTWKRSLLSSINIPCTFHWPLRCFAYRKE